MQRTKTAFGIIVFVGVVGLIIWLTYPANVTAHCDTLDGPVVMDAKTALEKGDVTPVLKWVDKDDELEIRAAFQKTLAVRTEGPEAKELADMYFFETLVRIHRASEGAPYTGLKSAGQSDAIVAAADRAIAEGNVSELAGEIGKVAEKGIEERFEHLMERAKHKDESVEAGREYVDAYVTFIHYVEGLHNTIAGGSEHH